MTSGSKIVATVDVTNQSNKDGIETVQCYIHDMIRSLTPPDKELKHFQKVSLKAGETKSISFEITEMDLSFFNNELTWTAESGEFEVFIGPNSSTDNKALFKFIK
ncbi:MAG: fibronectin type III-like domain-contianing protein [Flavobacteriales bacterium]